MITSSVSLRWNCCERRDSCNIVLACGASLENRTSRPRFPEAGAGTFDYLHRGGAYPDYFSKIQYGQIQPRLGIAWNVTPKTVIRAGGGEYFTRLGVSDSIFLGGNPPFQPTANVSFGSADNPGGAGTNDAQCETLIRLAIEACERYFPTFQFVIWAGKSAEQALEASLLETVGEA